VSTAGRRLIVEADGGSRGNPGPAGYGAVVRDAETGEVLAERAAALGTTTNNVAEYQGLIAGLRAAVELAPSAVEARLDSKLVVEQLSGRWKVKQPHLQPLAAEATALARSLPDVRFTWVPRARNTHADRLANEAMDAAAVGREWRASSTVDDAPKGAGTPQGTASSLKTPSWTARQSPATKMLLLRHGETEYSVQRRFSGRGDPPLTERGLAQAAAAAKRLAQLDVSAVLTSPLSRATATAAAVAAAAGLEPIVDDGLIEIDFGEWEGLTSQEVRDGWPSELDSWMSSTDHTAPGGESLDEVGRRVRKARDRAIATYPARTVVLVSHVTPIKALLRMGLGAGPSIMSRLHLDVASLSIVDWYADGQASVRLANDTSHLT
jgi:ribonuclease H / adenosylcobalamin/alpha-ribazole phosphatase